MNFFNKVLFVCVLGINIIALASDISLEPGQSITLDGNSISCGSNVPVRGVTCRCNYHNDCYYSLHVSGTSAMCYPEKSDIFVQGYDMEKVENKCRKLSTSTWYELTECSGENM